MRFVQTGDIHIGESRSLPNYLERHEQVLMQIANKAIELKCPLVVAGDLFHTKNPTADERYLAERWLGHLNRYVLTIVAPGNHDHIYGDRFLTDGYRHLGLERVIITGADPQVIWFGDTAFLVIPWGGYTEDEISEKIRSLITEEVSSRAKYLVAVAHECIVGSRFDNGIISPKGCRLPVIPQIRYWVVGDIHTHQRTNLENGFYAGAPLQFRFDDQEQKGILVVDLEKPTEPEFVPLQFKPLRTVSTYAEVKDDAYYMVRGDLSEVVASGKDTNVLRTSCERFEQVAIDFQSRSVTYQLPQFLAERGLTPERQQQAVKWVEDILTQHEAVA
jgi:DNA repair exonuclease SbcCD nuclease subunit